MAVEEQPLTAGSPNRHRWRRAALTSGGATIAYAMLAALAFYPVLPWSSTSVPGCVCYDTPQQIWFMSWVPHLLGAGGNPLFTTAINAPAGANMIVNVSMMFVSASLTPITLTMGPVAALNVAMRLAFLLSALSMFTVLRKWHLRLAPAFLGGLLYAFSPYVIGQAASHLQLGFVPIPPLWLYALGQLLSRRWTPRRVGLVLGGLAVIQFFIDIEIVATLLLMSAVGLAALALVFRDQVWARLSELIRAAGYAAFVAIPLLAVPVFYLIAGPGAVSGPPQPVSILVTYRADLLSLVVPTVQERLGAAGWLSWGTRLAGGSVGENGEYLGIPLVLLLGAGVVWLRRSAPVLALAAVGAVAYILCLGPNLVVDGHSTWIRLPFDLLSHLPLLQDELPGRFSLYLQLSASVLVALTWDRGWRWICGRGLMPARRLIALTVLAGVTVACSVPLWPAVPYVSQSTSIPAFFRADVDRTIPSGATVLTYPYPVFPEDQAMMWQAVSGLRFTLVGGYVYRRTPSGGASLTPAILSPPTVQDTLSYSLSGVGDRGLPPGTTLQAAATDFRSFLHRYGVSVVIVANIGVYPGTVADVVSAATGVLPLRVGGILLWHVPAA